MEMYNLTLTEDANAVAIQQPGLHSRMVPHGRLMPASERPWSGRGEATSRRRRAAPGS